MPQCCFGGVFSDSVLVALSLTTRSLSFGLGGSRWVSEDRANHLARTAPFTAQSSSKHRLRYLTHPTSCFERSVGRCDDLITSQYRFPLGITRSPLTQERSVRKSKKTPDELIRKVTPPGGSGTIWRWWLPSGLAEYWLISGRRTGIFSVEKANLQVSMPRNRTDNAIDTHLTHRPPGSPIYLFGRVCNCSIAEAGSFHVHADSDKKKTLPIANRGAGWRLARHRPGRADGPRSGRHVPSPLAENTPADRQLEPGPPPALLILAPTRSILALHVTRRGASRQALALQSRPRGSANGLRPNIAK